MVINTRSAVQMIATMGHCSAATDWLQQTHFSPFFFFFFQLKEKYDMLSV